MPSPENNSDFDPTNLIAFAADVLSRERDAVDAALTRLDDSFVHACQLILSCEGRVIVVGMGKSGHIGGKIAATLASTGTPAFFVHPGEASHGDLGMITRFDLVLALSNSGETPEVLTIVPLVKRMGVKLIAMSGGVDSTLCRQADVCLNTYVEQEACPHDLAPTSSTTVQLVMGDALAVALLRYRGFTPQDFARSHPGGSLGRRLLLYVRDVMHPVDEIAVATRETLLRDALPTMTQAGLGMIAIVDAEQRLCGVFTDGDLRRTLNEEVNVYDCQMHEVMTAEPVTSGPDILAAELVAVMRTNSINGLFVVNDRAQIIGALNTLDLLRAGVM